MSGSVSGDLLAVYVYLDNKGTGHSTCYAKGVIYENAQGDIIAPYYLLGSSNSKQINDNLSPGWVAFDLTSPVPISTNKLYWLGAHFDGNAQGIRVYADRLVYGIYCSNDTYSDGTNYYFYSDVTYRDLRMSCYATQEVEATPGYGHTALIRFGIV